MGVLFFIVYLFIFYTPDQKCFKSKNTLDIWIMPFLYVKIAITEA